jgi:hypothetical protein
LEGSIIGISLSQIDSQLIPMEVSDKLALPRYSAEGLVIAPSEADETSAAYFANTPVG